MLSRQESGTTGTRALLCDRPRHANVGQQPLIKFEKLPYYGLAFPATCQSGQPRKQDFRNHPKAGKRVKSPSGGLVELRVLPQGMFHLRNGVKQRLAAELIGRLSMT
jgi:hypothetical protein